MAETQEGQGQGQEVAHVLTPVREGLTPGPRVGRPSALTQAYARTHVASAVEALETAAGGRKALIAAITAVTDDDDLAEVLGILADPRNDARRLSDICKAHHLPVGAVIEAFKRGVMARAFVESQRIIAEGLPPAVADVMRRAAPHEISCESCRGIGTLSKGDAKPELCPTCDGKGVFPTLPDLDRQKLALELGGLTKKGGGILIDNRQQSVTLPQAAPGSFGALLAATDAVLHRRKPGPREDTASPPVVDAIVTETLATPEETHPCGG